MLYFTIKSQNKGIHIHSACANEPSFRAPKASTRHITMHLQEVIFNSELRLINSNYCHEN